MSASVHEIFGILHFLVNNSTMSEIHPNIVLGMYTLFHISASWLILCTGRVLHVVPMMLFHLAYCELLLLLLVELPVGGCNQTLYRYVCNLIGGYRGLIYIVYLGLVLLVE